MGRSRRARIPEGQRVYAIGDIHGRFDLLERLTAQIADDARGRSPADTELILLGDLIDRGPDSARVVRWAMRTDPDFATLTTLKGNHEASFVNILAGETRWLADWLHYGGDKALLSWGVDPDIVDFGGEQDIVAAARAAVSSYERHWLASLPLSRQIGDYLFVHAGIRPGVSLAMQEEKDLLWIREEFLDHSGAHGPVIVHGHSITTSVDERGNRIGIDTGAYASDRLTAIGLEGDRRWFLDTGP